MTAVDTEKNLLIVTGADDGPRVHNPATEWQVHLQVAGGKYLA